MPSTKAKKERHLSRDINNNKKNSQFKTPLLKDGQIVPVRKNDFVLGHILGAGGFGSVYMAQHKYTNIHRNLAVKILKKPNLCKNPAAQLESFKAELQSLTLSHKNLVQTLGATDLESFESGAWIVMEYSGHRTLQKIIDNPEDTLCRETRLRYALQLSAALKYLHQNSVLHLDVKPCNIMITPDGDCKLGDFGCSQKLESSVKGNISPTQRSHLTGTFAYRAPELLRGVAPSMKADIYGYGITLWQMFARESPYGSENEHVVIFSVVAYGQRPKHPQINDSDAFELCYRDLYSQCWEALPDNRPSSDELVEVLKIWKDYI